MRSSVILLAVVSATPIVLAQQPSQFVSGYILRSFRVRWRYWNVPQPEPQTK